MNCSDGTNITIQNIRFSTNSTANFTQKNQLNGSIQPLNFQIKKQNNSTQIVNSTYWQISPDPGAVSRICAGYVIFSAEAP
jgi:heme-binding NEAT domain protein